MANPADFFAWVPGSDIRTMRKADAVHVSLLLVFVDPLLGH